MRTLVMCLTLILSACASHGDAGLASKYPMVTSIQGDYSYDDSSITCSSSCQINYTSSSAFTSQFGNITCNGNLVMNDTSLSCSSSMTVSK